MCGVDQPVQDRLGDANARLESPVRVRIGLAAGEPVTEADDLFGAAVQLAAYRLGWSRLTGVPVEQIEKDSDRDRWFTAQEAKEYGFVDHVYEASADVLLNSENLATTVPGAPFSASTSKPESSASVSRPEKFASVRAFFSAFSS